MTARFTLVLLLAGPIPVAFAQGTPSDYARANGLRAKYEALTANVPGAATWVDKSDRFWYRRTVKGGAEFIIVDADTTQKRPAFDHQRLAAALSAATGHSYTATTLPFNAFTFADDERAIEATFDGASWRCGLADFDCRKIDPADRAAGGGRGAGPARPIEDRRPRPSPDRKWDAFVSNFNIAIRQTGTDAVIHLSFDGSEGNAYDVRSIAWSPDSKKIAAYRVKPGYRRELHYVESSPSDQVQPKHTTLAYAKPGDVLDVQQPVIFDVASKQQLVVDSTLFPSAYSLSRLEWRKDARAITFEYNQRGHQVYRVIEVDAASGKARAVVSEEATTFFNYRTPL